MNKKIVFYTQIYFLDASLEYIKFVSNYYKVSVFIELYPGSTKANIFDLEADLENFSPITNYNEVKSDWKLERFDEYLTKCESVNFVIFKKKTGFKAFFESFLMSKKIIKKFEAIAPDYIHFDDSSNRQFFLLKFILHNRKICILNVHDPKPHKGEFYILRTIHRFLLFTVTTTFVTFSEYSKNLLHKEIRKSKKIFKLKLSPYSIYKSFISKENNTNYCYDIAFVGRLSPYKGIDILLETIQLLKQENNSIKAIIAGKSVEGYNINQPQYLFDNLKVIDRHLNIIEMVEIIVTSKIVICPYTEATQSGVIMTAHALGRPVIVTNVGGLPEYILQSKNGIVLASNTCAELANQIKLLLENNNFISMITYLENDSKSFTTRNDFSHNISTIAELYV
ncbi:glycosyltransferase [Spirosoma foliorum]|uniref:Glycosyltransferase family 4 protein n=1 Tax=Spirosoma foliorum TaxID=2710596 RepID=A0A7G5H0E3_9BACT|nr:glycosyltransferase family 4 protein [Spirosoma foliorum]QMW04585.1 glycosyltransferase family 4 protein [Spirosoma foliorum]